MLEGVSVKAKKFSIMSLLENEKFKGVDWDVWGPTAYKVKECLQMFQKYSPFNWWLTTKGIDNLSILSTRIRFVGNIDAYGMCWELQHDASVFWVHNAHSTISTSWIIDNMIPNSFYVIVLIYRNFSHLVLQHTQAKTTSKRALKFRDHRAHSYPHSTSTRDQELAHTRISLYKQCTVIEVDNLAHASNASIYKTHLLFYFCE